MSTTVKRVIGAVVGLTAVAFLGIFAVGMVDSLRADSIKVDDDAEDYDDGEM